MTRYRRSTRWVDPNEISTRVRSEKAVRGYMDNPNWSGPDFLGNGGKPLAHRNSKGKLVADVGNHRIEAAKRSGRKIKVEIAEPIPEKKKSFWSW